MEQEKIQKINNDFKNGFTYREIREKYGISMATIIKYKNLGVFLTNSLKDSIRRSYKLQRRPIKLSEEAKKKISNSMKKYLSEHPDKVPYLLNHSSMVSYPERYFIFVFKKEKIDLKYHVQIGRYQLDFCDFNQKKYVEIDGESHFTDKKTIKIDKERTEFLKNLGWKCIRIRWKDYKRLNLNERKNKIKEIKDFIELVVM